MRFLRLACFAAKLIASWLLLWLFGRLQPLSVWAGEKSGLAKAANWHLVRAADAADNDRLAEAAWHHAAAHRLSQLV